MMLLANSSNGRRPAGHLSPCVPDSLTFSLITLVVNEKLFLVSKPAAYGGTGETICRSVYITYSIISRCMFSSVLARFDHTRMSSLDNMFTKLIDEAHTHLRNMTMIIRGAA